MDLPLLLNRVILSPAHAWLFAEANGQLLPLPEAQPLPAARRAAPVLRHLVWLGALFVVCAVSVSVRLDVQQLRKDWDRNQRATREARVLNQRLRLELDARHRAVEIQRRASELGLGPEATIVRLHADEGGAL